MANKSTTNTQILEALEAHNSSVEDRLSSQAEIINTLQETINRQSELVSALVAMGGNQTQQGQRPANVQDRGEDNLTTNQRNSLKQVLVRALLAGKHNEVRDLREQMATVATKENIADWRPINDWVGKWLTWARGANLPVFPQGMDPDVLINNLSTLQQGQAPSAPQQQQAQAPQQDTDVPPHEGTAPPAPDADVPFPV